jgi:hypothetical protein
MVTIRQGIPFPSRPSYLESRQFGCNDNRRKKDDASAEHQLFSVPAVFSAGRRSIVGRRRCPIVARCFLLSQQAEQSPLISAWTSNSGEVSVTDESHSLLEVCGAIPAGADAPW